MATLDQGQIELMFHVGVLQETTPAFDAWLAWGYLFKALLRAVGGDIRKLKTLRGAFDSLTPNQQAEIREYVLQYNPTCRPS